MTNTTYECKCGFGTNNLFALEAHFNRTWSLIQGKVEKNGHTVAKICGVPKN